MIMRPLSRQLIPLLLRSYPAAWRERYVAEVEALLEQHTVRWKTVVSLLLGAWDAHQNPVFRPERSHLLERRIPSSTRTILCAFILFCLAWGPLHFVSDSPAQWTAATRAHPELVVALIVLNAAGLLALLAVLGGCLALVLVAIAQAWRQRNWRLLALALAPVGAALLASAATLLFAPSAHLFLAGGARVPLTTGAQTVRVALVVGDALAGAVGFVALGRVLRWVTLGPQARRVLVLAATVAAGALLLGMVGGIATVALVVLEAQALSAWPPVEALVVVLLLGAAALALSATWRQMRSTRAEHPRPPQVA